MNASAKVIGGAAGSLSLMIAYDYNTCHPMRKFAGYDVEGAFIRLHNYVRWNNILPLPLISLSELSQYDGTDGHSTYFSANGSVYDVSSSDMFQTSYSQWKGKDATVALAQMSLNPKDINRTDWDALSDDDLKSLHSWTHYFNQKYLIKGRLKEFKM
mmetsp:Transcript_120/g.297  ORF Transcript_120/g.297 Transcript_120/m.297 type:complete len:157 (-) Transcript_120:59-529(-)|eukprot:CAMPEP_0195524350 /NCGR_PEP_ID=MMETSP0794_2-20130614/24131_1 /TAXON_ID=515487 /ORGANISM="Stephanopyxis turris, Strain CCMP 815" /LENGTH=156 /DNA_ID=CAMNT_0040654553 /DNA_START=292 /DNA_END=762 /DNA_ORIENTATION=+